MAKHRGTADPLEAMECQAPTVSTGPQALRVSRERRCSPVAALCVDPLYVIVYFQVVLNDASCLVVMLG